MGVISLEDSVEWMFVTLYSAEPPEEKPPLSVFDFGRDFQLQYNLSWFNQFRNYSSSRLEGTIYQNQPRRMWIDSIFKHARLFSFHHFNNWSQSWKTPYLLTVIYFVGYSTSETNINIEVSLLHWRRWCDFSTWKWKWKSQVLCLAWH